MHSAPPPGWSKTIEDLIAENRSISGEEIEWARRFEREELKSWARFPRPGEIYELINDAEISYVTHWSAPFTGGGKGLLRGGTRVCIGDIGEAEPIGVYADALEKLRIEAELVPEADRKADLYGGYSLSIKTAELNRLFRLVGSSGDAASHPAGADE
jgi:hypothetical protein